MDDSALAILVIGWWLTVGVSECTDEGTAYQKNEQVEAYELLHHLAAGENRMVLMVLNSTVDNDNV